MVPLVKFDTCSSRQHGRAAAADDDDDDDEEDGAAATRVQACVRGRQARGRQAQAAERRVRPGWQLQSILQ